MQYTRIAALVVSSISLAACTDSDSDSTAPEITLNGSNTITINGNSDYLDAGASAIDSQDGDLTITVTGSVDTSTLGEYILTFTATDAAGNSTSVTRTVIVVDGSAPEIVVASASLELPWGSDYDGGDVTVVDDFDDAPTVQISGEVNGQRYGDYVVSYTASDASGNQVQFDRTVTILKPNHQIVADYYDTCVLTDDDGKLRCWGYNDGAFAIGDDDELGDDFGEASVGRSDNRIEICKSSSEQQLTFAVIDGLHSCSGSDLPKIATWSDAFGGLDSREFCLDQSDSAQSLTRVVEEPYANDCEFGGYGFYHGVDSNNDGILQISDMEGGVTAAILPDAKLLHFDIAESFGCGVFDDQTTRCWGENDDGVLGTGFDDDVEAIEDLGNAMIPVNFGSGRYGVEVHVSENEVACALLNTGEIACWGDASESIIPFGFSDGIGDLAAELGDAIPIVDLGTNPATAAPYQAITMTMNDDGACAVLEDGNVKCWGDNDDGKLGQGQADVFSRSNINPFEEIGDQADEMGDSLPVVELGGIEVTQIHSRYDHVCALANSGQVKCWGSNNDGQLGVGDEEDRGDGLGDSNTVQFDKTFNYRITELSSENAGLSQCADAPGNIGVLLEYGADAGDMNGELDDAEISNSKLYCDTADTVTRYDGSVTYSWSQQRRVYFITMGSDDNEMGDNLPFVELPSSEPVTKVVTSYYNTCVLYADGKVSCWGDDDYAGNDVNTEFGTSAENPVSAAGFVDFGTEARVVDIAGGGYQHCAVFETGQVKCWGYSEYGEGGVPVLYDEDIGDGSPFNEMGERLPFVEFR
ncbi:immunoglobulin-like domain-containing protein [Ferrimonas senticii]|uniref:immunoglobulin-like domain-containing protein n=1 Tax=Ferrimonas senticii TaxID=394566 RepID=UPI0004006C99|nr:immunoglobulin-like domain-containing protein [Ferrimonas senticii]